jgi:hypothetical protein
MGEQTSELVKEFTLDEVQKHTSSTDCWLIIGNSSFYNLLTVESSPFFSLMMFLVICKNLINFFLVCR